MLLHRHANYYLVKFAHRTYVLRKNNASELLTKRGSGSADYCCEINSQISFELSPLGARCILSCFAKPPGENFSSTERMDAMSGIRSKDELQGKNRSSETSLRREIVTLDNRKTRVTTRGPRNEVSGATLGDILGAALKRKAEEVGEKKTNYEWKAIESLSDRDKNIDLAATKPLYETWRTSKERLAASSSENLKEFNQQLVRRLSIETGILERIYDLDRGTTEALVAHGFVEDLVSRSSTDIEPARLIDILRDQEAAVELVMDCVVGNRALSKGLIHELHAILTRHQETTTAIDQFGNRHEIPLLKGKFKTQPNNPRRPDGTLHEYCPPIHVEAEIDQLLYWFEEYQSEDPIILATWLHHRFTQIHPYQDGNGRVARAITTLVFLRTGLLPLVIDRDLRLEYIEALERADFGNLEFLASLFARLERAAIMQALSVDTDAEISYRQNLTSAVVESLGQRFARRREAKDAELRRVNNLALRLRAEARKQLEEAFAALEKPIANIAQPQINIADGGPDHANAHWYKYEVGRTAKETGKFANFSEDHYFVKASARANEERLVFVASFHHVGRELSGIMEATCFAHLESYEDSDDRDHVSQDFRICAVEPFVFTYKTKEQEIAAAFERWLDAAVAVAFKEFGDRL
jgi:Fic family protein